jgi:hypothetical protein
VSGRQRGRAYLCQPGEEESGEEDSPHVAGLWGAGALERPQLLIARGAQSTPVSSAEPLHLRALTFRLCLLQFRPLLTCM